MRDSEFQVAVEPFSGPSLRPRQEFPEERDAAVLQRESFAVHERQVQEHALVGHQGAILPGIDPGQSQLRGLCVRGEHARTPTEHVARELVEQHDERDTASGCGGPASEPARNPLSVRHGELLAQHLVKVRVFLPPAR